MISHLLRLRIVLCIACFGVALVGNVTRLFAAYDVSVCAIKCWDPGPNGGEIAPESLTSACPFVVDVDNLVQACEDEPGGSFEVDATMGAPPYQYSIDGVNFQASNLFENLSSGMYTITVQDNAGCTVTTSVNIIDVERPITVLNFADSTSCGMDNARFQLGVGSGTPPFTFIENGMPQSSPVFNNVSAGTHTVYVVDASGCLDTLDVVIPDAGFPMFDTVAVSGTICSTPTGTVFVEVSGGVINYMYSLGGSFQNADFFINVPAGSYTVTAVDAVGCTVSEDIEIVDIPGPMIDGYVASPTLCGASTGSVTFMASGGSGVLLYWIDDDPLAVFPIFGDLSEGTHTISAVDTNGCVASQEIEITSYGGPSVLDFDVQLTTCGQDDGVVIIHATGEGALRFKVGNGSFSSDSVFTDLSAGLYTFVVGDESACTAEVDVLVEASDGPIVDAIRTNEFCDLNNGEIYIFASGGIEPYEYSFNGGAFNDMQQYTGLTSDFYDICVRDAQGCIYCSEVFIDNVPPPVIDSIIIKNAACMTPGALTVYSSGGIGNHEYSLDSMAFQSDSLFSGLQEGHYTIFLVDEANCTTQASANIIATSADTVALMQSLCNGDTLFIGSNAFSEPGQYEVLLVNNQGCDSLIQLNLNIGSCCIVQGAASSVTICEGDSYVFHGTSYTMTGVYADTMNNATSAGCDSIAILDLHVTPPTNTSQSQAICSGQSFVWNGNSYTMAGTYMDTLMSVAGCDSIVRLDLAVNPLPQVAAGADQTLLCDNPTVSLTANGTGTPTWNGPGVVNVSQWSINAGLPGQYIITATSAQGCQAMDTVIVFANPAAPVANAGPDGTLSCIVSTAVLSGSGVGSNLSYTWYGPGVPAALLHTPMSEATVAGIYYLIVTDTISGCVSAPDTAIITDLSVNLVADITGNGNIDCTQQSVMLGSTGSSSGPNIEYEWHDPANNITLNVTTLNATIPGTYYLYITDSVLGCEAVDSFEVLELVVLPPANAGPDQNLDCVIESVTLIANGGAPNNNFSYQWSGPAGGITTNPTAQQVTAVLPGNYSLTVTDMTNGCSATDNVAVADISELPIADAGETQELTCNMSEIELDGSQSSQGPEFTHVWNGPGVNNVNQISIDVILPGLYTLLVTNTQNGCDAMDSVLVTAENIITGVEVDVIDPSCFQDSTGSVVVEHVQGGTPPYVYSINGVIFGTSPVFDELLGGTYTLTIYDDADCKWEEELVIEDADSVYIDIGPDLDLGIGETMVLNPVIGPPGVRIDSIRWTSTGGFLSCTDCLTPTLSGDRVEAFRVTANIYFGDCVLSDFLLVKSRHKFSVFVPNVFSPNGDLDNDYVTIYSSDEFAEVVEFSIFNYWGEVIFRNTGFPVNVPELGWDGSFKGQPMLPGVYIYQAYVQFRTKDVEVLTGDITLLR